MEQVIQWANSISGGNPLALCLICTLILSTAVSTAVVKFSYSSFTQKQGDNIPQVNNYILNSSEVGSSRKEEIAEIAKLVTAELNSRSKTNGE